MAAATIASRPYEGSQSPGFAAAVESLQRLAAVDGLSGGYAIFPLDLSSSRWVKGPNEVAMERGADEIAAVVPESETADFTATLNLIAGLLYAAEEARHILVAHPDPDAETVALCQRVEREALGHVFGEVDRPPAEVIASTFRQQAERLRGPLRDLALRSATRWSAQAERELDGSSPVEALLVEDED